MTAVLRDYLDSTLKVRLPNADSVISNYYPQYNNWTKQTAAELAAGVTPIDFAYPSGDVRRYGAVGNGVTDDTAAIRAAMSVQQPVYIPGTNDFYLISDVLDCSYIGQTIYGDGRRSLVVQTSNVPGKMAVFRSLGFARCRFIDLYAKPYSTGDFSSGGLNVGAIQAFGFDIEGADQCEVRGCFVSDHRRGGILIYNSNYCKVIGNWIIDSVVTASGITLNNTGADIYIAASSSRNEIIGNHCINGAGIGISIQTLSGPHAADYNIVVGNEVRDQDIYGIMVYIQGATDSAAGTVIMGNVVENITGDISQDDGLFTFGAGLYIQTAAQTIVVGNQVRNTNSHASPSLQNVPAAIAVSGDHNTLIANNLIEDPNYWGIAVIQGSSYTATGRGIEIVNNKIRNCDNTGIYCQDVTNAKIMGNRLHTQTSAANGIYVRQAAFSQCDDFQIIDNKVDGFGIGIVHEGTINRSKTHKNIIRGNTGYGIYLTATNTDCSENAIENGTGGDGIGIASTCADGFCINNRVIGGDFGVLDDNGATLRVYDNIITGATTPYSSGMWFPLANSATPTAKNKRWVSNSNTTTITNLTNGYIGQVVTIQGLANFTVQTGSGIDLNGAANFNMTANDTLTLVKGGSSWTELSRSVI